MRCASSYYRPWHAIAIYYYFLFFVFCLLIFFLLFFQYHFLCLFISNTLLFIFHATSVRYNFFFRFFLFYILVFVCFISTIPFIRKTHSTKKRRRRENSFTKSLFECGTRHQNRTQIHRIELNVSLYLSCGVHECVHVWVCVWAHNGVFVGDCFGRTIRR